MSFKPDAPRFFVLSLFCLCFVSAFALILSRFFLGFRVRKVKFCEVFKCLFLLVFFCSKVRFSQVFFLSKFVRKSRTDNQREDAPPVSVLSLLFLCFRLNSLSLSALKNRHFPDILSLFFLCSFSAFSLLLPRVSVSFPSSFLVIGNRTSKPPTRRTSGTSREPPRSNLSESYYLLLSPRPLRNRQIRRSREHPPRPAE